MIASVDTQPEALLLPSAKKFTTKAAKGSTTAIDSKGYGLRIGMEGGWVQCLFCFDD
jgi:hypothetical protein